MIEVMVQMQEQRKLHVLRTLEDKEKTFQYKYIFENSANKNLIEMITFLVNVNLNLCIIRNKPGDALKYSKNGI